MATVTAGGTAINLPRRSNSNWDISFKNDEAFGPQLILQHGTDVLYVMPDNERDETAIIEMAVALGALKG